MNRAVVLMMVSKGMAIWKIPRDIKRGGGAHDVTLYKKQQGRRQVSIIVARGLGIESEQWVGHHQVRVFL